MELPCFILLKSNAHNKYLSYSKVTKGSNNHASLRFSDSDDAKGSKMAKLPESDNDDSLNSSKETTELQYLKFEVEKAKSVEGLVHIRTCYNNKYWVRKSEDSNLIVAEANEAEEDQSKWSSTLFKPVFLDSDDVDVTTTTDRKIHLLHGGQRPVGTCSHNGQLRLIDVGSDDVDVFTAVDADSTPVLPSNVVFMGPNGKYLVSSTKRGGGLEFKASGITENGVAYRTLNLASELLVFDHDTGSGWNYDTDPPFIALGLGDDGASPFNVIKYGDHIVLRCLNPNSFANVNADNVLCASARMLTDDTLLKVGEPVLSREIDDATYDLNNSRIYNQSKIEKFRDSRSNKTSVEQNGAFQVEYKISQTTQWSQSITVNLGISVSWSAGIPFVGDLGVDVSYEHDQSWEWGEEDTEEQTVTYTQNIIIPPGQKVTLQVLAQKAYCDVPFTCKVKDLMTNGDTSEYTKTDGLFTGCNEYNFDTVISKEDL